MTALSNDGKTAAVVSSGLSEGCSKQPIDERKRRRMESNRESARRSRQKKQDHLDGMLREVTHLTRENGEIKKRVVEIGATLEGFDSENMVLRANKDSLAARLEKLELVIEIAKVVRGSSSSSSGGFNDDDDNNNKSDPMMKPWQLPCPSVTISIHSFKDYNLRVL